MKNFIILGIIVAGMLYMFNKSTKTKKRSNLNDNSGSKVEIISYSGENVDLASHAVNGGITLFDFYADWCGPCKGLSSELEPYVKNTPGVYLKKINIKDWNSPVAQAYQVNSIPSVWIYDQNGRQVKTRINRFSEIKDEVSRL